MFLLIIITTKPLYSLTRKQVYKKAISILSSVFSSTCVKFQRTWPIKIHNETLQRKNISRNNLRITEKNLFPSRKSINLYFYFSIGKLGKCSEFTRAVWRGQRIIAARTKISTKYGWRSLQLVSISNWYTSDRLFFQRRWSVSMNI